MLSYDDAGAIVGTWALQYEAEPKETQQSEQAKPKKKKEKQHSNADEGPAPETPKAAVAPAQADSSSYKAAAPATDSSGYKAAVAPAQAKDSSSYAAPKVQPAQEPAQQVQTQSSYQELGNSLKASQKELGITDKQCDDIKKGVELIQGLDSNGELLGLLNRLDAQKQASKLAYIGQKYGSGDEQLGADRARYFITFGTGLQ